MLIHTDKKPILKEYTKWNKRKLKKYVKILTDMTEKYYQIITTKNIGIKTEM
jgi:hypothetical protein